MLRRLIIGLLPTKSKIYIKQRLELFKLQTAVVFASFRWSATLYYLLVSSQFRREMIAVLQGRKVYAENLSKALASSPLLRRNVHRLEKGLIMRPRRPVFAVDYIGETVAAFEQACHFESLDAAELKWATDVLMQYFQVCGSHPVIDREKTRFLTVSPMTSLDETTKGCCDAQTAVDNSTKHLATSPADGFVVTPHAATRSSVPYRYADLPTHSINFSELSLLFQRRRSVRWFLPKTVPKELIYQAVEAASQAPSACNRQPFRFDLLANPADAQKIAALAMGTAGFEHNIQCLLVVVGDLSCYPAERDRHVIYIDASLATMQLMLALETLGLASCPINWPDIEARERAIAQKLELPVYQRPVMLLAVGYADPAGGIAYSQKKSPALLIREVSDVD